MALLVGQGADGAAQQVTEIAERLGAGVTISLLPEPAAIWRTDVEQRVRGVTQEPDEHPAEGLRHQVAQEQGDDSTG